MTRAARQPWLRAMALAMILSTSGATVSAQETVRFQTTPAAREVLDQAQALLASGDSQGAYVLLKSQQADQGGAAYFNYLLGVAALDSGRVTEAVMGLRRAASAAPRFSAARLELARALFEGRDYAEARLLFTALLGENPPAGVRDVINRYINSIDSRPTRPPARFAPFAELFSGYDSNANGSTDNQQFLGFTLSPENLETDSSFFEAGAGFDWAVPRSARLAWQLGARASYRANPDADFVDAGLVSAAAGMRWRSRKVFGHAGVDSYAASRDGDSNEAYTGANLLLGRQLNARWDLTATVRGGAVRFDDAIDVLDVNRILYTLGVAYRPGATSRIGIEAVGGNDNERQGASPYGNSKAGGRLSLNAAVGDSGYLFASLGTLRSDYDGLFFGLPRDDTQVTAVLGVEFRDVWTDGLSIAPRLRYIDNNSDIDLYVYQRLEAGILIRWVTK